MKAISPEGNEIIGTLEVVLGVARANVALSRNGKFKVEFLGDTDVDWNSQKTKTQSGERLFVCSQRKLWREGQIKRATQAKYKNR